jgi:nucleoside-diphosphate-sugar epimerase
VWDTTKPDGQPRRGLDISRAKSLLGWTPKQDFDAGLKTTVEWWRAHGRS